MPKLGESVTEGTINKWLVQVGDQVNKYDPIVEVMTDKVNAEVPSSFTGVIKEIVAEEGETVAVNKLIGYIEVENDTNSKQEDSIVLPSSKDEGNKTIVANETHENTSLRARYSPAVLKLATEHQIDLETIKGTGLGGRITRKDVEKHLQAAKEPISKMAKQEEIPDRDVTVSGKDIAIPVTGVRKAIANKTVLTKQEIPHARMTVEVDVTDMVHYRDKIKAAFEKREGYPLTYFAFFVHAVAKALKEFPELNSTWAKDKIIQRHHINISIAVANDHELFVPVIKNADEKSITGIAKEINQFVKKARANQLKSEDMEGGTFTVNNTGTFVSVSSMGIINHPQAAILQVEAIVKRPVIINDMFAARNMVNLSLSLDHRVLDGLICGRFLARVKELLENTNEKTATI